MDNLEKFLQLDGINDEFEDQIASNQQHQQRIVNNNQTVNNQQQRQGINQVQTYLKVNAPVVINHELLASYGVQLNNQQQYVSNNNNNNNNAITMSQPISLHSSPITNNETNDKYKIFTKSVQGSPSNQTINFINTNNNIGNNKAVIISNNSNNNEIKTIPISFNSIQTAAQSKTFWFSHFFESNITQNYF